MSIENNPLAASASSPQLLLATPKKTFNIGLNQSSISKKPATFKSQASEYLKSQLSSIIKDQLKAFRIQKKLQKQLLEYKRVQQKKKIVDDLHKVSKFRQKQSQVLRSNFDNFLKYKEKRETKVEEKILIKKDEVVRRRSQNQLKIQTVRKRFFELERQDVESRLSRADSIMSLNSLRSPTNPIKKPKLHRSNMSLKPVTHLLDSRIQQQQATKITNYLRKMKHAQSKIIQRQIKFDERKEKSIKSHVKNLTRLRDDNEQSMKRRLQERFDQKMETFYRNMSRIQSENSLLIMNKSRLQEQNHQRVIRNKHFNDRILVNKTIENFTRKRNDKKENLYRSQLHKLDVMRTRSSFLNKYVQNNQFISTVQIRNQQLEKQKEKRMRFLYEKLNRIKGLRANQTLTEKEREMLINMMDHEDPAFAQMAEYISNTKNEFLKKKLQKQQEKAKAQKNKKIYHKG